MQMTMASSGDKDEVDINMQMFSSLIYPSFSEISSGVGGVDSVCFKGDAWHALFTSSERVSHIETQLWGGRQKTHRSYKVPLVFDTGLQKCTQQAGNKRTWSA